MDKSHQEENLEFDFPPGDPQFTPGKSPSLPDTLENQTSPQTAPPPLPNISGDSFQEETRHVAGKNSEILLDRAYIPACLLSILGIFLGMTLCWGIRGRVADSSALIRLLVGLLPFQVSAFFLCLLGLIPLFCKLGAQQTLCIHTSTATTKRPSLIRELLVILGCVWGINGISVIVCRLLGIPVSEQFLEILSHGETGWLFWIACFFSAVILAPITEEILFRVVMFRCLRSLVPAWSAVLTSAVFAYFHGQICFFPGLFCVGFLLQRAFLRDGLTRSMLLHSIYNAICLSFILIGMALKSHF